MVSGRLMSPLAAMALLAGCLALPSNLAPAAVVPAVKAASAALPYSAALNAIVDSNSGEGEPSLGVTPNGTLFTDGIAQGTLGVYESKDGGRTWKNLGSPIAPFPNDDPDLAVGSDGAVWADALSLACATVSVSRDTGATWSRPNPAACDPPAGDRQYVIPTKGGEAFIYTHPYFQMVAQTKDYGATWTPSRDPIADGVRTSNPTGGSGWGGGGFWNAKTGSVFITFTWNESSTGVTGKSWPAFAVTRDDGATWQLNVLPGDGGAGVGLGLVTGAADRDGNVYLTWAEAQGKGDDMAVLLVVSHDDGRTWSKPIRVDQGNESKVFPVVTAGAPGSVAIAYYEANEHGYPAHLDSKAMWNVTLAWTTDAMSGANLTFHYGRLSNHTLRQGPICPDGTTCTRNRDLLDYFALKTMPDGRVASVWTSTSDVPGKLVNVFGITQRPILGEIGNPPLSQGVAGSVVPLANDGLPAPVPESP
ncbi:MAG: sialidase family protein [Thermoplasmatota archaeon]